MRQVRRRAHGVDREARAGAFCGKRREDRGQGRQPSRNGRSGVHARDPDRLRCGGRRPWRGVASQEVAGVVFACNMIQSPSRSLRTLRLGLFSWGRRPIGRVLASRQSCQRRQWANPIIEPPSRVPGRFPRLFLIRENPAIALCCAQNPCSPSSHLVKSNTSTPSRA